MIWLTADRIWAKGPCWGYEDIQLYFGKRKRIALKTILLDKKIYNFDRIWLANKFLSVEQKTVICKWIDAHVETAKNDRYLAASKAKMLCEMMLAISQPASIWDDYKNEVLKQIQELLK